jgi:hypothetical protein
MNQWPSLLPLTPLRCVRGSDATFEGLRAASAR